MRTAEHNGHEITTDERTVWVNHARKGCVARITFGGLQVGAIEMRTESRGHWEWWRKQVKKHSGVKVPANFRPDWCSW